MHAVAARLLAGAMLTALVVVAQISSDPMAAHAAECPPGESPQPIPGGGTICIPVSSPGTPGDPGNGGSGGGGGSGCKGLSGQEIPCSRDGMSWYDGSTTGGEGCYASPASPPAPPEDPFWPAGEGPDTGALYDCILTEAGAPFGGGFGGGLRFFLPGGQPPPDPRQMAQDLLETMQLAKPTIHMAPSPPAMTYVGLDTWLWMDQGQWAEITDSATIRTTTVTVTAAPSNVAWDLTDGSVNCPSAGRPWVKGMSSSAKTDCSYAFQRVSDFEPNDSFGVSAQIEYQVDWTCSGLCIEDGGTLGVVPGLESNAAIRVGERQSVVVN